MPTVKNDPHDAFLSYNGADRLLAEAVQQALERFMRPLFARRAMAVFRDESSLAQTNTLRAALRRHLERSRFLLLVASPASAASPWVREEAAHWIDLGRLDRLMILRAAGRLVWDAGRHGFTGETDCLPPALMDASWQGDEPMHLDFAGIPPAERTLRHRTFEQRILKIVARIRDIGPEELDRARRREQRTRVAAVTVAAMLAAGGAGWAHLDRVQNRQALERAEAERQREAAAARASDEAARRSAAEAASRAAEAASREAEAKTEQSIRALDAGRFGDALQLAHDAVSGHPSARGQAALYRAVRAHPQRLALVPDSLDRLHVAGHFTADGAHLLAVTEDERVQLWDIAGGRMLLERHRPDERLLEARPCGTTALAAWATGVAQIVVRDVVADREVARLDAGGTAPVEGRFDRACRQFVAWGGGAVPALWALAGTATPHRLAAGRGVAFVAFSADGRWLATAGAGDALDPQSRSDAMLWSTADGRSVGRLTGVRGGINGLRFSPDDRWLLVATDIAAELWDVAGRRRLARIEAPRLPVLANPEGPGSILDRVIELRDADFSPDGRRLATAWMDGAVRLHDLRDPRRAGRVLSGHLAAALHVHFGSDGRTLLSTGDDGTARIHDLSSGRTLRVLPEESSAIAKDPFASEGSLGHAPGRGDEIASGSFGAGGRLAATLHGDGALRVWALAEDPPPMLGRMAGGAPAALAFSTDGRRLAAGGANGALIEWDLDTLEPRQLAKGAGVPIDVLRYGPPDDTLAVLGADGGLQLWPPGRSAPRVQAGGERAAHRGGNDLRWVDRGFDAVTRHYNGMAGLVWCPGGIGGLLETVRTEGIPGDRQTAAAADGILAVECGRARLLDAETGAGIGTFSGVRAAALENDRNDGLIDLAFSPDGTRFATIDRKDPLRPGRRGAIWDARTRELLHELEEPSGQMLAVLFGADGSRLYTTMGDGRILVWDTVRGDLLRTIAGHRGFVYLWALSEDGRRLASVDEDFLRVLDTASGEWLENVRLPRGPIRTLAITSDGRTVAVGFEDGRLQRVQLLPSGTALLERADALLR